MAGVGATQKTGPRQQHQRLWPDRRLSGQGEQPRRTTGASWAGCCWPPKKLLLEATLTQKLPAVILRAAGIYGPGRGHLFLQYLKDEARIPGRGERLVNMIHRDDLAACILAALKSGRPGEVYNAVDDEPVAQIHFFRWLSETLGKNMPPFVREDESAPRKRALTNKKVSNRKLRMELGCPLRYPTFRQGYTAEIQRLQDAGEL